MLLPGFLVASFLAFPWLCSPGFGSLVLLPRPGCFLSVSSFGSPGLASFPFLVAGLRPKNRLQQVFPLPSSREVRVCPRLCSMTQERYGSCCLGFPSYLQRKALGTVLCLWRCDHAGFNLQERRPHLPAGACCESGEVAPSCSRCGWAVFSYLSVLAFLVPAMPSFRWWWPSRPSCLKSTSLLVQRVVSISALGTT